MNNKILSIIILTFIVTTTMSTLSNSTSICESDDDDKIIDKQKKIDTSKYPVMIEPPDLTDIENETPKPMIIETPDEFSWLDHNQSNWVTPVKYQGGCGSCWDFALIGTLESVIKIREKCPRFQPDLSEQYVLSCLPSSGSCRGGSAYKAAKNIFDNDSYGNYHNGVIPENCMAYKADDDIPCSEKCSDWVEKLIPISDYGYHRTFGKDTDRELIKTLIIQKGPVASHIKATDFFKRWGAITHGSHSYYPDWEVTVGVNHVIIILGWKDSALIKNGGYWICKNSWSTDWGYNGLFNIEYGALGIDKSMIVWVDYNQDDYNWRPIAKTEGPYSSDVGKEITFDAINSYSIEGDITSYKWDFGNGETGNGKTITHTYLEQDEYTVKLTVTDNQGLTSNVTTYARVQDSNNNPPDKPNIEGKTNGKPGENYVYEIYSVDPDEDDIYYKISWGDGTTDEYGPEVYLSGEKASFTKKWDKTGRYTIEVTAMDRYGAESKTSRLSVSMPKSKNRATQIPYLRFLENYPIIYHLIQRILNFI